MIFALLLSKCYAVAPIAVVNAVDAARFLTPDPRLLEEVGDLWLLSLRSHLLNIYRSKLFQKKDVTIE